MAILRSCCCFNNVRTGSIACAIYTLLLALLSGGISSYNLFQLHNPDHDYNIGDTPHYVHLQEPTDGNATLDTMQSLHGHQHIGHADISNSVQGWFFTTLAICILLLIASVLVIVGIHKENRFYLVPWIYITILMMLIDTAALIYQCISLGLLTFNIIQMVIWLALTLLNIYCVLCVVSQYQELKAGRGTLDYLRQQRATVVYHSGIQQVHITQGPIVMSCAEGMRPAIYTGSSTGPSSVTATLMTMPPDYNTVTRGIPQYSEHSKPLATPLLATTDDIHKGPPPPAYQP